MDTKTFFAGWSDVDFHSHRRNTIFLERTADVRRMFLVENGVPVEAFLRLRIGPVVVKDEVEYFKEDRLLEEITVTRGLAGHAVDGSRFLLWHEIVRSDGGDSTRSHR